MQRAKAFFYVCAGLFLLALSYHFGAQSAQAQTGNVLLTIVFNSNNAMFAAMTDGSVYESSDYGATWSSHTLPFTVRAGTGAQSVSFRDTTFGMAFGGGSTAKLGDQNVAFSRDGSSIITASPLFMSAAPAP